MSMLDILKRKSYSEQLDPAAVLTRYSNDTSLHSCVNVFTEGPTDEIFYNRFIVKYYEAKKIKYWVCGKKENVQEVLLMFKNQSDQWQSTRRRYNKNNLLFILDRDFVFDHEKGFDNEQLRNDKADTYENVFNTSLHSFENYLVNEETFRFLITKAFNISDTDSILELENQFKNQYKCFVAFHLFCYAWLEVFLNGQPRNILEKGIYENSLFFNSNLELEMKAQFIKNKSIDFNAISNLLIDCLKSNEKRTFRQFSQSQRIEFEKRVNKRHAEFLKLSEEQTKKIHTRKRRYLVFYLVLQSYQKKII
jgi:hypothetical protein